MFNSSIIQLTCPSLVQLPVLVHELLAVEVWRENVFPRMIQESSRPTSSFPAYLVVSASHLPPTHAPPTFTPSLLHTRH